MKNQIIKINKSVFTPMGDECSPVFVPVMHMMRPRQNQNQQQMRNDSLQAVLFNCDFIVPVMCAKSVEDIGNFRRMFAPYSDTNSQKSIREIAVEIPEGKEFSETNLTAATVAAFENVFAKGGDGKIAKGVVELVEI